MPKMKTRKSVACKFKVTGTGKLLRRRAGKRHLLSDKSSKRKQKMGKPGLVFDSIAHTYKKLMCVN